MREFNLMTPFEKRAKAGTLLSLIYKQLGPRTEEQVLEIFIRKIYITIMFFIFWIIVL